MVSNQGMKKKEVDCSGFSHRAIMNSMNCMHIVRKLCKLFLVLQRELIIHSTSELVLSNLTRVV